jgi:hypothetical protein
MFNAIFTTLLSLALAQGAVALTCADAQRFGGFSFTPDTDTPLAPKQVRLLPQ